MPDWRFQTYEDDPQDDERRIVRVAAEHGVTMRVDEAHVAWALHSQRWCAGWLFLPEDDESLWRDLLRHCIDVEDS